MKLEAAIVATVLLLVVVTFAPVAIARFRRAGVEPETYAPRATSRDATAVLRKLVHQPPDAAERTRDEVVTYLGGASSRSVSLELVRDSMPLAAADITKDTVRFVGDGSYDVVKTGALDHAEFEVTPIATGTSDVLGYRGRDALKFLRARQNVMHKRSEFRCMRLRSPDETVRSHDLSAAVVPVVPEICKHAALQALSMTFSTAGAGTGGASVFVLPHRGGLAPAAFHVRFYGNDLLIKYHVLQDAVGLEPNAVVTMSAEATSRAGGEVFLMDARTGTDDVAVYAELTKGHVRVCTEETARRRSYYLKVPLMFSEDNIFLSDSIDPPSVFVRTYDVERPLIVPFAVGDLSAFDRVRGPARVRTVRTKPYAPTVAARADSAPVGPGVVTASFVPETGALLDAFKGGMARSKAGLYGRNGGYAGYNETRTKSGAVVRGEWIQADLGRPVAFQKLKYAVRDVDVPRRVVVLGSNDDGWTQIAVESRTPVKWTDVAIPLTGAYRQYRVVVTDTSEESATLAREGQTFDRVGDVQFGARDAWVTKAADGAGQCTAAWFGRDPAPGVAKECRADNGVRSQGTVLFDSLAFA